MNDSATDQRDLRAYLAPVLKRWWLIVAIVPIVTVGTYIYYDHKPQYYEATAELYLQPSTLNQLFFGNKSEREGRGENYALLIQTGAVGNRALRHLAEGRTTAGPKAGKQSKKAAKQGKGDQGEKAPIPRGSVSAQAIEKTNFILVTATSDTPRGAARLANAYSYAFVEIQRGQVRREASAAADAARKQLKELGHSEESLRRREAVEQQIQQLELIADPPKHSGGFRVVEPALPVPVPHGPDPTRNAIFAFVIGLMLAIAGAYGLEYLNRRIGSVEDAEEAFGLPVLTEVPQVRHPAPTGGDGASLPQVLNGPFQRLQTNLEILSRERPIRTILVASAAPHEGKSIVARNLALAYREAGRNVAVLDADFHQPSQGSLLAAADGLGLADVLAGQASFGQVVQEVAVHRVANGNGSALDHLAGGLSTPPKHPYGELALVPAGSHQGLFAGLASSEMSQMVRTAVDAYGTAIIDSPPLLAAPDVLPLLAEVDAVVIVARIGVSTRDSAQRLTAELERMPGVRVAGVVVNGIPRRVYRARSYGYGDG